MAAALAHPKAFAVWFKDLARWDPASFQRITWKWAKNIMQPIGSFLRPRKERVDRTKYRFAELLPITIHFDGSIDKREIDGNREYTMDLFFARPGDVVVAKIDLKNGAVGIVPDWKNVAVTGHFAVYKPDRSKMLPQYFHRVIQTSFFKEHLWRNKVGAEGRKEVKLDFFEAQEVPLPPLTIQEAIVAHWRIAQDAAAKSRDTVAKLEAEREDDFFRALGIRPLRAVNRPKFLAVLWRNFPRWAVSTVIDHALGLHSEPKAAFRYVSLGNVASVSYDIQKCPANRPGTHARPYLRVANVRKGYLDLSEIKSIDVPDSEMESLRLLPGDILFVEGNGSRAELGRVAMWNGEIPDCVHQNHLIKVRCDTATLLPAFAMTWFNTDVGRGHFFRSAKTSSGLGTINSSEVRAAPIPLPPVEAQREIVDMVNRQRARIAEERKASEQRQAQAAREVEEMILGIRPVG